MNFEKDIGSLYVNKDGSREPHAHEEVGVMDLAEVVSKSNFLSILIDGSTIYGKGKKSCIHSVVSKGRIHEGGNPTVTLLLNLLDVRDVSVNADALKVGLDRFFNLIKEHCIDDNVLKNFISNYTDRASTNIGCNDNLFTRLVEEHSHLIPFWCIVHQLELAIKKPVGK